MSGDALLEARGAAFGYAGTPIVSGVELALRPGERVACAGPNGSGKTTLFRGLLGLLPPLAGAVRRGTDAIGYVPQHEELDPVYPLTARELVEAAALGRLEGGARPLRRLSRADRAEAERCLGEVGLADRAGELYASLSGGQRQRVLIARALMTEPRLLFLDEPTSGVDREASRRIAALLRHWSEERGTAVVLVGHQFEALREFAERALWVDEGTVIDGPAGELLAPESVDRLLARGPAATEERAR